MPRQCLLGAGGKLAAGLTDTFTDTTGVGLDAHTADTGQSWTEHTGTWEIQSNALQSVSNADGDLCSASAGISESVTTVSVTIQANRFAGTVVRLVDGSNFWLVQATPTTWELYENSAGFTLRANTSVSLTAGNTYPVSITCSGTTITCLINGGNSISYGSATAHQTAIRYGFRIGTSGAGTAPTFDTLQVV